MKEVVWTQWADLLVPEGFVSLSPSNCDLDKDDLSEITFYVPQYMGGRRYLEYSKKMPNLRYLQMPNAGVDDAMSYVRPGITLCNARGVHDASTAELAVGLAITARRGFADFAVAQKKGEWAHKRYSSFNDSNIAIIGNGSIANTIKKYLTNFDVTITMFSKSGKNNSELISTLPTKIAEYDVIFLAVPLTDDTRGLLSKELISKMKIGATLVNVARGPVVDTEAMIAALNTGHISAGLDVTDPEPLPANHPLWTAKNCIISPHVGGDSTAFDSRCKKLVEDQLARLSRGEALINII